MTPRVAGESVAITLDEQLFVKRGHVASHEVRRPVHRDDTVPRPPFLDGRERRSALGAREFGSS